MSQRKLCQAGLLLWMCVMNRFLDTAEAASSSTTLSITHCVIMQHIHITCYWKTTNHHLNNSSYRLQINKTNCETKQSFITVGECDTRGTNCSVQPIDSVLHCFHADVLASTHTGFIRSPLYFFSGVSAVKLAPPQIINLNQSARPSECLQVTWGMNEKVYKNEEGYIWLQIEYTTHDQTRSQTIQAFPEAILELCDLHPGSKYTVRLRAQDIRAKAHWSSWTSIDTTTAEKAPSAAPRLWRHIQPAEEAGKRRLTLLWKPVSWPEVNGVVLSYSVSCRSELDSSQWTCGALNASRSSCVLIISVDPCHCNLTATNSAGTSPPAHIYIPAHTDAEELPPPQITRVTPLDDTRLKVEWTATLNQSERGFVLQWSSVPYSGPTSLHWEHINKTARSFILTGLLPEVPYNLSVVSLYERQAGSDMSAIAFTREGAPSVGPKMTMLKTSSSGIVLKWEPVPIEKLHGFIQHYTVLYSINGKSEEAYACVEQMSLTGLTTGTYNICVMAHTAAGGAAGPWQMVAVGLEDVQVIPILLCALLLSFLILIIPLCLRVRIKQCLCPTVPDPSKSSLSIWSNTNSCQHKLTSTMSSIISISQATSYQGYCEKDYVPVQVFTYHTVRHDENEAETKTTGTYLDPKPAPTQAFSTHLLNQSYTKPDQAIPAGYKDDSQPSSADLLFDSLFNYKRSQVDLSSYIHVSQSYAPFVTTIDAYRTLELDECSHFLQVLPEDTST
ncbi:interleukin-6 receptor subunit beta isoform X1 [Ctenopharyngodon idella]|uniref:interleukin-6 receptor subunit beta isoform X1 n=1 Tax=Ctenopharyngodon idella TaxID=7959 RepID=UPI0022304E97|nr:interleukin-6 receptor subunit beta isoform X1 [Ctenopharyngodon idella]XP_051769044.1 interleukin-6 receptor subunit beta isoform X1 [Ctenopharyngodon idella]